MGVGTSIEKQVIDCIKLLSSRTTASEEVVNGVLKEITVLLPEYHNGITPKLEELSEHFREFKFASN